MNTVYKLIFNVSTGTWAVASELTASRGKKSRTRLANAMAAVLALPFGALMAAETEERPECSASEVWAADESRCVSAVPPVGPMGTTTASGVLANFVDDTYLKIGGNSAGGTSGPAQIGTEGGDIALGAGTKALGGRAVAIGQNANAGGTWSVAIGGSNAVGQAAEAAGNGAVALGVQTKATAENSVALGRAATVAAAARGAVVLGANASATHYGNVAIGHLAQTEGHYAIAIGGGLTTMDGAQAKGRSTLAIGANSKALAERSAAIGVGSSASADATYAVALGNNSVATEAYTVAVGGLTEDTHRRIVNMAAGTADTDAVNVGQMKTAMETRVDTAHLKIGAPVAGSTTGEATVGTIGSDIAMGIAASATGGRATAVGQNAIASGVRSIAIGGSTEADQGAQSAGRDAIALGSSTRGDADGAVALGRNATVHADATNAVALGLGAIATEANTVSVGGASAATHRRIVNMAAGTADTDAVNVRQLNTGLAAKVGNDELTERLKGAGVVDEEGNTHVALRYDRHADGSTNFGAVTLGNGNGTGPTQLKNVAAGTDARDAVNLEQLNAAMGSVGSGYIAGRGAGAAAQATSQSSVALGINSVANGLNTVSVGNADTGLVRRITNVGDGTARSDAATVGQMNDLVGGVSSSTREALSAFDSRISALDSMGTMAAVDDAYLKIDAQVGDPEALVAAGSSAIALGAGATATGSYSAALGADAAASGTQAVAIGGDAKALANGALAMGTARAEADNAVALGMGTQATGRNTVAAGMNAHATGTNAVAIGNTSRAQSENAVAVGSLATVQASATHGVALGRNAVVSASGVNAVALGAGSIAERSNAVSVGSAAQGRQIVNVAEGTEITDAVNLGQMRDYVTEHGGNPLAVAYIDEDKDSIRLEGAGGTVIGNLAAGEVSATSTDAINGAQLHGTATSLADALGGGATVGTDGKVTAPSYTLGDATYNTVGEALTGLDGRTTGNSEKIVELVERIADVGLIDDKGDARVALTYDQNSDGTPNLASVTLGETGTAVTLSNLAAGAVSATSTDAINGGQLHGTAKSLADALGGGAAVAADGTVTSPSYTIGGSTHGSVGEALANLDTRTADNSDGIVELGERITEIGLIDAEGKTRVALTYDQHVDGTPNMASVTLGETGTAVQLKNVAAGEDDSDAVNLAQMRDYVTDRAGNPLAVAYAGEEKDSIQLAGADGTVIRNVAAGAVDATSTEAINGAQLHGTATSLADALGGGAVVGTDGTVTAPAYTIGGSTHGSVGDALANLDTRTVDNSSDIAELDERITQVGLVDEDGNTRVALTYDQHVDGTPNFGSVTLGNGTDAVRLKNVAAGVDATDAVNMSQLTEATANPHYDGRGSGTAARAMSMHSVAVGLNSVADEINTVSVGNSGTGLVRRITNVADGQKDTDAATVGQVNSLVGGVSTSTREALSAFDSKIGALADIGTAAVDEAYLKIDVPAGAPEALVGADTMAIAVGSGAAATGAFSMALGTDSVASGTQALAIGGDAQATANGALALGTANASAGNAVALGNGTNATGNNAVATGFNAGASGTNAIAVGNGAKGNSENAIAMGMLSDVNAAATNSIAIGRVATVTAAGINSVALGAGSVADRINSISVGSTTQQRQIINVAAGTADTDAVNFGQMKTYVADHAGEGGVADPLAVAYSDDSKASIGLQGADGTTISNVKAGTAATDATNVGQLQGIADAIGGGAGIAADGSITAPSFVLGGASFSNVGDALTNLDGRTTANSTDLTDLSSRVDDLSSGGVTDPRAVTYSDDDKGAINLAGADGTTISNVKAGTADMDAVNVAQVKGIAAALGGGAGVGADGSIIAPTYTFDGVAFDNVGDAMGNLNERVVGNASSIVEIRDELASGGIGLVTQDATSRVISVGGDTDGGEVSMAGTGGARVVTGVAAGVSGADAVNVGQLQPVVAALGGGATIDASTGAVTGPTYNFGDIDGDGADNIYTTVGGALENVNGRVVDNSSAIGDIRDGLASGSVGLVRQDSITGNITVGAETAGTHVDIAGTDGARRLGGVANGSEDDDVVTIAQLRAAGAMDPVSGETLSVLTYDGVDLARATLGGTGGTVIGNLANGLIAAGSMEAVNGGQLFQMNADWEAKWTSLDGRVVTIENGIADGSIGAPGGGGGSGDAGPGAGDSSGIVAPGGGSGSVVIGEGTSEGDRSVAIGEGASAAGNDSVAIGSGSVAAGDKEVSVGAAGSERRITNVAAGIAPTDAVNLGQMNDRFQEERDWSNRRFQAVDKRIDRMGAISAAYAGMALNTAGLSGDNRIGAGVGNQNGRSALAVGYQRILGEQKNISISLGGAFSGSDQSVSAGAGFSW
ncbi:ESPR-type extended signal peptide-containing protein [Stenotrophomonas maltophilia]|uniref:ESPR-type extended signal peptide-containing protein n=1 Tax=Stenotrophomonas maltophilia TaxID=40324 RepID=UPI0034DB32AF